MIPKTADLRTQIEFYAQEVSSGKMDLSAVRNKLKNQMMDLEDVKYTVNRVDKRAARLTELKGIHQTGKTKLWIGITLLFFGCVFPFIYNIVTLNKFVIAVYTFPFVLGLYLIWNGRNDMARY
ncbi:hypothetical protein JCM19298_1976 [Nonlabens ulvanivorans]|nr:hypothetical protein [Nonlabens ulvanivorans]GAK93257.1 hypothetical protein JCM19298_1976 [Nonlabens ulvanivorans]